MDITTILSVIYAKISASTSTEEILILSKIAEKIKIGNVRTVSTYYDMYTVTDFTTGTVFFVESEENLYYAINTYRIPLLTMNSGTFSWGRNAYGQLGDNTAVSKSSPVSMPIGFGADWAQLSAGGNHTIGLRFNGVLSAWGRNNYGQLGDNAAINRSSPVSVTGGFTDWINISAGDGHSLAIRSDETAWAWGSNGSGRLGDNTDVSKSSPVSVVGGFTDWIQVSAGGDHSTGLRANRTVWTWGRNTYGNLGDYTTTSRSSPVSVVGGFTDWVFTSAGAGNSFAIRSNGTAWAWGKNDFGQLGDNTAVGKSSPVSVVGGFTDWTQISGNSSHTVGLRSNGTVWSWGRNNVGQLGDNVGTTSARSSPVSVVGGFTDWVQISVAGLSTRALRANGTAWGWGYNGSGRLGDNTTTNRSSPVSVVGGFTDWVNISSGSGHSAAIRIFK